MTKCSIKIFFNSVYTLLMESNRSEFWFFWYFGINFIIILIIGRFFLNNIFRCKKYDFNNFIKLCKFSWNQKIDTFFGL